MLRDLLRGLSAPLRGMRLLATTPRLRKLAMMPLAVNVIVFLVGVPVAIWLAVDLVGNLMPSGDLWQGALRVVLQIVVAVAVLIGSTFAFVIIGNIIASPFNSKLSEAIEEHLTGRPAGSGTGIVVDVARSIGTSIGRLIMFLVLYPPIFAVQFIPVVGVFLHPVLAVLYGSYVLSLDFSDPTFERHYRRFREKMGHIWGRKWLYLGFGLTAVAMAIIPIVNFLLLPVCVTGAAMLYLEEGISGDAAGKGVS